MECCKGESDWLVCLKCPLICTYMCPLEKENAVEALKEKIRIFESCIDKTRTYKSQ